MGSMSDGLVSTSVVDCNEDIVLLMSSISPRKHHKALPPFFPTPGLLHTSTDVMRIVLS